MNPAAMAPHGAALRAYLDGELDAALVVRRDDGTEFHLPVSPFFRDPESFTPIERAALERCTGHVLDAGAGTGLHSLFLQQQGLRVTSLDISAEAVGIMTRRGLSNPRRGDIFSFTGDCFDTILMLGHGLGMVETMAGLDRFLTLGHRLVSPRGQILLDSLDVRQTDDPANLAYQRRNRLAGRYVGETVLQFEFRELRGPFCGWLHVDPQTLREHAARSGWRVEVIVADGNGNYLARLSRRANQRRTQGHPNIECSEDSSTVLKESVESVNDPEPSPSPVIVPYRPEYREAFRQLNLDWLEAYRLLEPADLVPLEDPETHILANGGQVFFALLEEKAVGACAAIRWSDRTFELAKLAVDAPARGRGLGRRLSEAVIDFARQTGAGEVFLTSNTVLATAIRLYESLGFCHRPMPAEVRYKTANVYMVLELSQPAGRKTGSGQEISPPERKERLL